MRNNTDGNENKFRLQKTHFILGNSDTDYSTKYNRDYYKKISPTTQNYDAISHNLQKTQIYPGSDEVIYVSETSDKYKKPDLNYENFKNNKKQITINTEELQRSHLELGSQEVPWISSNRYHFPPKRNTENIRYYNSNNSQNSYFGFLKNKEDRNFKSEAMEEFIDRPLVNNTL